MTLILKGTHGTTSYHAENIKENGFTVQAPNDDSTVGKAGYGVYFWNYINTNTNAVKLSEAWWSFSCKKNMYDKTKDCSLNIFDVEVEVEENYLLDFVRNIELHEAFIDAYPIGENEQFYGAKLDLFIKLLEQKLNHIFEIVRLNLSVPELRKVAFANSFPAFVLKTQKNVIINNIII
jgi:hypothetical protein